MVPDPLRVDSPYYWPEAPPTAHFDKGNHSGDDPYGWTVQGMPDLPWPYARTFTRANIGPPGTTWEFSPSDLAERHLWGSSHLAQAVAKYYLRLNKLPELTIIPTGPIVWTTPGGPSTVALDVYRITVHAKIGTVEEAVNVLHYVPLGTAAATEDDMQTLAEDFRAAWSAFLNETNTYPSPFGSGTMKDAFYGCTWDEIRAAKVHLAASTKPDYIIPNQYAPFADGGVVSTGTKGLPAEVALCLSLGTTKRGPRNRGRSYLGPLATAVMGTGADFDPAAVGGVAAAWGTHMAEDPNSFGAFPCKLVVASALYGTSQDVTRVTVGQVPDSQRRRRRSEAETRTLQWGT